MAVAPRHPAGALRLGVAESRRSSRPDSTRSPVNRSLDPSHIDSAAQAPVDLVGGHGSTMEHQGPRQGGHLCRPRSRPDQQHPTRGRAPPSRLPGARRKPSDHATSRSSLAYSCPRPQTHLAPVRPGQIRTCPGPGVSLARPHRRRRRFGLLERRSRRRGAASGCRSSPGAAFGVVHRSGLRTLPIPDVMLRGWREAASPPFRPPEKAPALRRPVRRQPCHQCGIPRRLRPAGPIVCALP